ncbi:RagB/SusD family nutrient uptake outer membrane protein [Sphingobacterium sp. SYP-B4668]|uniref:RagB/SusD family nutrient uptake outer membrane protein n=1 Tax=Sphingobacterium sp. SYP-B4668 TaxID=2996035 RepID=UPI0022DD1D4F|nr:RagB/SusD family nutrient uptake outer membrane protein [Sphingobacterium sp. SYP-B4668]
MKILVRLQIALLLIMSTSCNKYLDIVPDNVATIDYAFRMRTTAEKYLATCYSFMPKLGDMYANPGMFGADELWLSKDKNWWNNWVTALGQQNVNNPQLDYWNGYNASTNLWMGISQCNIFLENIEKVPDMDEVEKRQWKAEVKFLKAYYHFFLLRMYGPIPIIDVNLPISASGEEVRVYRQPVDKVFDYIVRVIDDATIDLRKNVRDENSELGRVTMPIAKGFKAKVLVYAASPLFNGNTEYAGFSGKDGVVLFNSTVDQEKWSRALQACKEAIEVAHEMGHKLYEFEGSLQTKDISEDTRLALNIRGAITDRWNPEIIWANTGSTTRGLQVWSAPHVLEPAHIGVSEPNGSIGVTMKIADLFYSKNGVPIEEDKAFEYNDRYSLKVATEADKYQVKEGYSTAKIHFNREARFYGTLGFDGGVWYGQGRYDDKDPYYLQIKKEQIGGKEGISWHSVTGYYAKKYIHYTNTTVNQNTYTTTNWPWVMLRLADLYLLYAEAANEVGGPSVDAFQYLDLIRKRSGLPAVQVAWTAHSKNPQKPNTKEGLRAIIRQERGIELALEGERFWDLRRWKTAPEQLNKPIKGWDVDQVSSEAYYREKVLFNQRFSLKDYFWPIREHDLIVNKNLVQNPGW